MQMQSVDNRKKSEQTASARIQFSGHPNCRDINQEVRDLLKAVNELNKRSGGGELRVQEVRDLDKENGVRVIFIGDVRDRSLLASDS